MTLYSTVQAGEILGLKPITLRWYHKEYGYGEKKGRDLLWRDRDLAKIRKHQAAGPGRRKAEQ